MVETSANKMRTIYKVERAIGVNETRSTSIDINDNVVVLGNSKGYIAAYEQTWEKKQMTVSGSLLTCISSLLCALRPSDARRKSR